MKTLLKIIAAAAVLLAAAIVFSPLLAALSGTAIDVNSIAPTYAEAFRRTFHGVARPLMGSADAALISAVAALGLGLPFAILVDRSGPSSRRICWALGLLVLMIPPYVVAEAWIVLLGPTGRLARPVAMLLGFGPRTTDPMTLARFAIPPWVYTRGAVGLIMGSCFFPIVALAVASAYRRTDRRIFEAARIAQGARGVFAVAARTLAPPALGGALLVFAATLTEFAVPQLLRVHTIGEEVYDRIQEGNVAAAAALSLPLLPLVIAAGAIGVIVIARSRLASMAGLEGEIPKYTGPPPTPSANLAAGVITSVAIASALVLPAISLTWLALTARLPSLPALGHYHLLRASGFFASLHGAWELAHDDAVRTVILASLAATLATGFAIALARLAPRLGWGPLLGALGAGVAVPAPIVGLGLITIWNRGPLAAVYESSAIVLLAWLARFLPIAIFMTQGALARVPRELESAAALMGRGPAERLAAIVLPNALPGLVAAWLAMYVLSATEFSATVLIAPPGLPMIAPSVVNLMRRGSDSEIAACQLLLLGVIAIPLVVIALAAFWRWRAGSRRDDAGFFAPLPPGEGGRYSGRVRAWKYEWL